MAGSEPKGRKRVFEEINITPLTDIFLVLLIIMMVVAPMVQQMHNEIRPPEIASGGPVARGEFTVEVDRDGRYYVDGVEATEADLSRLMTDAAARLGEAAKLTVRADANVKSHAVMRVFDEAQSAQFKKMMVVGELRRPEPEEKPGEVRP